MKGLPPRQLTLSGNGLAILPKDMTLSSRLTDPIKVETKSLRHHSSLSHPPSLPPLCVACVYACTHSPHAHLCAHMNIQRVFSKVTFSGSKNSPSTVQSLGSFPAWENRGPHQRPEAGPGQESPKQTLMKLAYLS